jgi:hypothetical protein
MVKFASPSLGAVVNTARDPFTAPYSFSMSSISLSLSVNCFGVAESLSFLAAAIAIEELEQPNRSDLPQTNRT